MLGPWIKILQMDGTTVQPLERQDVALSKRSHKEQQVSIEPWNENFCRHTLKPEKYVTCYKLHAYFFYKNHNYRLEVRDTTKGCH